MTVALEAPPAAAERMAATYPDPTARVNLMPPEILAARSIRVVKRRLLLLLVVVVIAIVAANGWFRLDDSRANRALADQRTTVESLQEAQRQFIELPGISAEESAISSRLAGLMLNDTSWDADLAALRTSAIGEIRFTGVTAAVRDVGLGAIAEVTLNGGSLDRSGAGQIGVCTVTGRAPDHAAVATWVASLSEVDGFLVPYILGSRTVLDNGGEVEFIVEITMGDALRATRYVIPPAAATAAGS